jgi:AcrR family transcriptional regulator
MNESTAARLIAAARTAFAERGYDGASIRDITTAAGVNLGAVTYHFGSKQALYDAVLEAAFAPVRAQIEAELADPAVQVLPPLDRLERLVRGLFRRVAQTGDLPLLIVQQVVLTRALPEPAVHALGELYRVVTALIEEGQRLGQVRPGRPLLLAVSVLSQPAYFAIARRFLLHRLPKDMLAHATAAELEDHAIRFVRAGLAA